jgi:glycosyltransferase involved in cell wall biosynthesis
MPTVSVLITTHNRARLVGDAIESVMAQSYPDWELVIVDDGSTDGTREIVAGHVKQDPRVRYVYQPNQGLSKSRTRGLELLTGDYAAFLDDDDLYLPDKLERQVGFLEAHPDVALVYSQVDLVDARTGQHLRLSPKKPALTFQELLAECTIASHSLLVRRACLERLGGFRRDLRGGDDYEMWLRIVRTHRIAFLPGRVGIYRWHDGNMSYGYDQRLRYADRLAIYRGLLRYGLSSAERSQVLHRCAQLAHDEAVNAINQKRYREAARHYALAVRDDPFIGLKIPWGRLAHPAYRLLRPYLAVLYCAGRSLGAAAHAEHAANA